MRIPGGKSRVRKKQAALLKHLRKVVGLERVEDRFCGSLAVSRGCYEAGLQVAAAVDINETLIVLYQHVRDGYVPPDTITREEYMRALRGSHDPRDPLNGFILNFCSFAGKYGSGYLPDDLRWPMGTAQSAAEKAARDLVNLRPMLERMELRCHDATAHLPDEPSVLYFDPEYEGTEPYLGAPPFDRPRYLRRTEEHKRKHAIIGSEFAMPDTWREIASIKSPSRGMRRHPLTERYFVPRGGLSDEALGDCPFPGFED